MSGAFIFNPPPGWPTPEPGWEPPPGWTPDPTWPPPPNGWLFWRPAPLATTQQPAPAPAPESVAPPTPSEAAISPVPDPAPTVADEELRRTQAELAAARTELAGLNARAAGRPNANPAVAGPDGRDVFTPSTPMGLLASGVIDLDDERVMQEVGIYTYRHPLENAEAYRDRLKGLTEQIKEMIRQGRAVIASDMFTFNNSLAKGRRMTNDLSKLMLRAYNAEAENAVRTMRAGNSLTAVRRLESAATSIAKLGAMMEMRVSPDYHALRIQELELTQDYLMKQQEDKERARDERERLREERKAEQELQAERERLQKERAHYTNVLASLRDEGDIEGVARLAAQLAEIDQAIAHNDYRTANIRAGYVYVISNVGAFGPNVVKIGMTRRLEPMDRVRELGDASVPFPFDVHALYFSDDAVTLEADLHNQFANQRLNRVNLRREFFFANPTEVRLVLASKIGNLLEFTEEPEAGQYFQSKKYWPMETQDARG